MKPSLNKCLLMFGLWIAVLLLAVFSRKDRGSALDSDVAIEDKAGSNVSLAHHLRDTIP